MNPKFKKIAFQRILELFRQAEIIFNKDPSLSDRYIEIARKIAMKYKVKIPKELKRKFCKNCYKYLVPGKNSRVRLHNGKLIIYCFECKNFTRIPYKPNKYNFL